MKEKYGFVYIWFDRKHKRYYIGCHWGREDDGYICSSNWMRDAYKRRPQDFKRRIISRIYTNKKDLFDEEHRLLSYIKEEELGNRYYNLKIYNTNHWSTNDALFSSRIYKMSLSHLKQTPWNKNKTNNYSKETIQKMRKSKLGTKHSEKTRNKMKGKIPWNKGVKCNEEMYNILKNATKGYMWITNGKECKFIAPNINIPEGWCKGRLINNKKD